MIFSSPPPQFGQVCISMSNTRLSSRAQLMRFGRAWAVSTSHSAGAGASLAGSCTCGPGGTTSGSASPGDYRILDERLRDEPYGFMLRKDDPQFKALVDETLTRLMKSGEINEIYAKWFQKHVAHIPQAVAAAQDVALHAVGQYTQQHVVVLADSRISLGLRSPAPNALLVPHTVAIHRPILRVCDRRHSRRPCADLADAWMAAGSKPMTASGWSSCAATSPGRRFPTNGCRSMPPGRSS